MDDTFTEQETSNFRNRDGHSASFCPAAVVGLNRDATQPFNVLGCSAVYVENQSAPVLSSPLLVTHIRISSSIRPCSRRDEKEEEDLPQCNPILSIFVISLSRHIARRKFRLTLHQYPLNFVNTINSASHGSSISLIV